MYVKTEILMPNVAFLNIVDRSSGMKSSKVFMVSIWFTLNSSPFLPILKADSFDSVLKSIPLEPL